MRRWAQLVLVFFMFLAGCVNKSIINEITIPLVVGVDKGPGATKSLTISIPQFQGKDKITNTEATAVSHTIKNAYEILQGEQESPIVSGKVSVFLYGRDLAKEGIAEALDTSMRDPKISKRTYLAVVDGRVKELMEADYNHSTEKGRYLIQQFISNFTEGHLPRTNLHTFEYALLGKGRDPYLPLVKLQGHKFKIAGLALFHNDKYVDSLNYEEMKIFKLLVEKGNQGTYEVKLNKDTYVSVLNQHSSFRYKMASNTDSPEISIRVHLDGMISESTNFKVTDNDRQNVETSFSKEIADTGEKLIHAISEARYRSPGSWRLRSKQDKTLG